MALKFNSPQSVEQVVWQMRLADYPRSLNRARINDLFNGFPPYSPQEAELNNIGTNVNDLSATTLDQLARRQIWNAFCVPRPIFTVSIDSGPVYKRDKWGQTITKAINKPIIKSQSFLELRDSVGAGMVLHGVGPSIWEKDDTWKQRQIGIEDVFIPSGTLRSMENLTFFAVYRQYSAPELYRLTHKKNVDPGWNMDLVKAALNWVDDQARTLQSPSWPEVWSPEKMSERFKEDAGLYASDAIPTVDCYDFYYYHDGKNAGWRRRMVLDAWGQPGVGGIVPADYSPNNRVQEFSKGQFLYDSGDRIAMDDLSKKIHFQFGDVSSVAPFKYHSVRSLGFLLYAVCHLQNRMKCKFSDAVFESLLQYFRINNPADVDRLQKIDLADKGVLPEGLNFVKPEERWQVNEAMVMNAITMNRQAMDEVSSSFRQDYEVDQSGSETATRTAAKVNASAQLVGSMVNRGYTYEEFRYREICRRFCLSDSEDHDIKAFRLECLKAGVPEKMLDSSRWNISMNRVIGGGNKMVQQAVADRLMSVRGAHGPEGQAQILRLYDATVSDDWQLAEQLNPEVPHVTDSIHDTALVYGAMMAGSSVEPRPGLNALEVSATMIKLMANTVQQIHQTDGVGTPQQLFGLMAAGQYTAAFIHQLSSDPDQRTVVKEMSDALGKIGNEIKGFAQRQQEMQQQASMQNGNGDNGKMQATIIQAQTKAKVSEQSHAQKTAQRQIAFQQKQLQDEQKQMADMHNENLRTQAEIERENAITATELRNESIKASRNGVE